MVKPEVRKKRQELAIAAAQSRKTRKKLEKVVLHRKNKLDRKNLLAELKKYQLDSKQLEQLYSTSSVQTQGLAKFLNEDASNLSSRQREQAKIESAEQCLNVNSLLKKKKRKRNFALHSYNKHTSSSSEETDAVSTDTEIYYESECDERQTKAETIAKVTLIEQPRNTPEESHVHESEVIVKKPKLALPREPAVFVQVARYDHVDKARLELPIIGEEQNIIEKVRYNDVVIISGETGSGKTTQIPQFLYEAGYSLGGRLIGVTEPRRVAAVSMSERVAFELNLTTKEVSYQIRFSGNVTSDTKIKFMTDGVLLRECQQDFLLSKYSVIIIDEAHERSIFSDILIGLLSRVVPMRSKRGDPLKLIIMSATLRVSDFTENRFLFRQPPPVIDIDARQFPVTMHFANRTPTNYLDAAFKKVCSVHSKMPKGGILVFVTSQMDVRILVRKLKSKFPSTTNEKSRDDTVSHQKRESLEQIKEEREVIEAETSTPPKIKSNPVMENLKENISYKDDESDGDVESEESTGAKFKHRKFVVQQEWSDDFSSDEEETVATTKTPLYCLGLYAMLPLERQREVFNEPPKDSRFCVVATNVAETSITIPNIKYVIDTGLEKNKVYDLSTGVSRFVTTWTSKSSAEQRSGRAGRIGPGHCYRLYSSAVFANDFIEHAIPRILQRPVEDVLLQMKSMNIDNVINFPFPTRPSLEALKAAEKKLILLGALDDSKIRAAGPKEITKLEFSSRPTALGKAMSYFGVGARCSKMIVLSPTDLLQQVTSLVSALTVREMFLDSNEFRLLRRKWSGKGSCKLLGDFAVMIHAIYLTNIAGCTNKFCHDNGLRVKAMLEIFKLMNQLTLEFNNNLSYSPATSEHKMPKLTETRAKILRQLLLSSYCDHIARKLPDGEIAKRKENDSSKIEKKKLKNAYECTETGEHVYICPQSVLKGEHPEYLVYKELYQGDKKTYMRDVAVIEPQWFPHYAHRLCNIEDGAAAGADPPRYDPKTDQIICTRVATYGPLNWSLGSVEVPMHLISSGAEIYKHFANFLLTGDVLSWFRVHRSKLLTPPSIMLKPWSKLQPRTSKILQALISQNVKSRRDLIKVWKRDKTCEYNTLMKNFFDQSNLY